VWYDLAIIDKTFLFQDSLKINLSYFFELLLRRQQALHQADPFLFDRQGKLDESILAIRLIIGKAVALSIGTTFPRIGVVSSRLGQWIEFDLLGVPDCLGNTGIAAIPK